MQVGILNKRKTILDEKKHERHTNQLVTVKSGSKQSFTPLQNDASTCSATFADVGATLASRSCRVENGDANVAGITFAGTRVL